MSVGIFAQHFVDGQSGIDDFQRPDSTSGLGSVYSWIYGPGASTDWGIISGAAYNPGGASNRSASIDTGSINHFAEYVYGGRGAGASDMGIDVRRVDDNNRVWMDTFQDTVRIIKMVAGSLTVLGQFTTVTSGDTIRLEAVEDQLSVYKNGTLITFQWLLESALQTGTKVALSSHTGNSAYRWNSFSWGLLTPPFKSYVYLSAISGSPITLPSSGIAAGQLGVLMFSAGNRVSSNSTAPTLSGWTLVRDINSNPNGYTECAVMSKTLASGDLGATLTPTFFGGPNSIRLLFMAFPSGSTVDVSNTATTGAAPVLSPTGPGEVFYWQQDYRSNGGPPIDVVAPSGVTIRRENTDGDTHFGVQLSSEQYTSGSMTSRTFTDTQALDGTTLVDFAIKAP